MDQSILFYLNKLASDNGIFSTISGLLADNPLLRGGPVFFCLFYAWFSTTDLKVKAKFALGFVACILAVAISVFCQSHIPVHVRPVFDNRLQIANLLKWGADSLDKRIYSFPSDTATLYFSLVAITFQENKKLGLIAFLWALFTVGACRVAVGVHYPSDILGGIILGGGLALLFSNIKPLVAFISRLILKYDPNYLYLNIFLALFCAEAYNLFPGLTQILYDVIQLLKGTAAN